MKIYIFLLNSSAIGGIEKVARNLSLILSESNVDVEVIDILELKKRYGNYSELRLCFYFLNGKNKNDIILSLYDRLSIQLLLAKALCFNDVKIFACQHADYYANKFHTRMLRRFFYKKAERIIALTSTDKKLYNQCGLNNVTVIPNPLAYYPKNIPTFLSRTNNVIAAGRLNKVKSFESVIDLAVIMSDLEHIKFSLYGDGEEIDFLKAYIKTLGFDYNEILRGSTLRLDECFISSKFLVVTSKRESFSMVILEAMASGCIPISFDCPTGPRELIEHGVNGFLVPMGDIFGIKHIIEMLLDNPSLAEQISINARVKASSYTKTNIMAMWGNVINEL